MKRSLAVLLILAIGCSGPDEGAEPDPDPTNQTDPNQTDPDPDPDPGPGFDERCDPPEVLPDGTMPHLHEAHNPHGPDDDRMEEHMAMLDLVAYETATHVSVADGHWCNPGVWHGGEVPGAGARVVIHEDHHLRYDVEVDEALDTVRVDGTLEFSTQVDSRLVAETIVVDQRGTLLIGTVEDPVHPDVAVEILFVDDGEIDVAEDPQLLGRGLIAHGRSRIHGAAVTPHLKVAVDPSAGDEVLHLQSAPQGWRPGDTLVLAGTRYSGWKWDNDIHEVRYHGTQDQVLTITAVDGDEVHFEPPLENDHHSPREDLKTSVAHFTRNVSFRNRSGADLPPHRRAHVMFMHSDDIDVRYAAFWHLGRTDKSREARDVESLTEVSSDTNIQGRYSFHFHRTGIANPRNPALAIGNAVFHSPGWGYVHHDSHAIFDRNASFDTFGAGFVSETGNETGSWSRNIAIRAEGNSSFNPKNGVDIDIFDIARTGTGFWFQGRMVRAVDNVAASVNQAYSYFHRGGGMLPLHAEAFTFPEALGLNPSAAPNHPPILEFHGNEAFASTVGVFVVKANPNQGHDVRSWMSDFTAWEVQAGADLEYTSHYTLENFDLIGMTPEPFRRARRGINFGTNTSDMVVINSRIEGFETGVRLGKDFTDNMGGSTVPPEANANVLIGLEFIDVDEEYDELDETLDLILELDDLVEGRFEFTLDDDDLSYRSAYEEGGRLVEFFGVKVDSIGEISVPSGTDRLRIQRGEMVRILEQRGYYLDENDVPYVIVEHYLSDRGTGEIHKVAVPVRLDDDVALHNEYFAYADAVSKGPIDFQNQPPVTVDVDATVDRDTEAVIDVLAGDTDPEGDELEVRGISSPRHGMVFLNADQTVTYRPDPGFLGEDRFTYWAHDGQGNFTPGQVRVEVR